MTVGAPKIWRVSEILWRSWGDEAIVFNVAAGDTHLLNPTAAQVLRILQQQPTAAYHLAQQIASAIQMEPDDELFQHVEKLLANLDALGLIEPLSS